MTAAEAREYSCYFHDSLRNDVENKLKSEGYEISSWYDQRDGATITITW